MGRIEPQHQPVEKPPPPGGTLDKQAIHLRRQPQHAEPLAERRLAAGRLAIDADHAAFAAGSIPAGADADSAAARLDGRRDSPAPSAGLGRATGQARGLKAHVAPIDLAEPGMAQAAPRRQKRHRFQQVGLAGAVRPGHHHRPRVEIEPGRAVIAKIGQHQPGHADTPANAPGPKREVRGVDPGVNPRNMG